MEFLVISTTSAGCGVERYITDIGDLERIEWCGAMPCRTKAPTPEKRIWRGHNACPPAAGAEIERHAADATSRPGHRFARQAEHAGNAGKTRHFVAASGWLNRLMSAPR
jgi:hypothetical protein